MLKKMVPGVALLVAALLPVGCSQNDPDAPLPGGPSTGLVITKVTAIPDVLPADGSSQATLRLEARLRTGDPLPGRAVAFYIVGSTYGDGSGCPTTSAVTSATDVTDANGVAWGTFQAGNEPCFVYVRGRLTDPRETEGEFEVQDDVVIEHY